MSFSPQEDPYLYMSQPPRPKSVGRGRGRSSKARTYNPFFDGARLDAALVLKFFNFITYKIKNN